MRDPGIIKLSGNVKKIYDKGDRFISEYQKVINKECRIISLNFYEAICCPATESLKSTLKINKPNKLKHDIIRTKC